MKQPLLCLKEKIMSKSIKAVIFDLDGTLIDTEKYYQKAWPRALQDMGYETWENFTLPIRSLGRPFAPRWFKERFGELFDYDEARRIRKKYFDEYVATEGIQKKKGAVELLEYLKTQGITTAVATATDLERANEYIELAGLSGYFDRVISATMVEMGKPEPLVYLYACEQLGLHPEECMAVEDAPNGIIAAYRAGLKVVMVPDLSEPDEETMAMLYRRVDSLDKIIELL